VIVGGRGGEIIIPPQMTGTRAVSEGGLPVDEPRGQGLQELIAAPAGADTRSSLGRLARVVLVLLGLPKTLLFNFRYLSFRQALRLPILVSHRVAIYDFGGTVSVPPNSGPGTVLLGFGNNGGFDYRRSRSVWQIAGDVVFEGPARLGTGFKLSVAGRVTFGEGFVLSAESQIICRESIAFGSGCLVSWDVLLLDSDFHPILSTEDGSVSARIAPITIGDRVWIGARSSVLKGVEIGDDVIVAAGSIVTRSHAAGNVLLGGNPAQVLRSGVRWSHN
jgi:acetyltransferase-like isoleucine patch superfamily enzyme